jgi:hypothetical protein
LLLPGTASGPSGVPEGQKDAGFLEKLPDAGYHEPERFCPGGPVSADLFHFSGKRFAAEPFPFGVTVSLFQLASGEDVHTACESASGTTFNHEDLELARVGIVPQEEQGRGIPGLDHSATLLAFADGRDSGFLQVEFVPGRFILQSQQAEV